MVVATDYPFLEVLWTMLIFFAWVAYIWMLIVVLTDLFRRHDVSGWGKAGWCVFMIIVPFIGVLAYLISQHDQMADRTERAAQQQQQQFDQYVKSVAGDGGGGPADEIDKAQKLLDRGAITEAEFESIKEKALAAH